MAVRSEDNFMALEVDGAVVATARFSNDAAADGNGAWIVSSRPARLFYHDQAITALTLAERLDADFGDDDPFVKTWHKELFLYPIADKRDAGSGSPCQRVLSTNRKEWTRHQGLSFWSSVRS